MAISKIMEKEVFNELNDELKGKVIDIYKHYQKQKNIRKEDFIIIH